MIKAPHRTTCTFSDDTLAKLEEISEDLGGLSISATLRYCTNVAYKPLERRKKADKKGQVKDE